MCEIVSKPPARKYSEIEGQQFLVDEQGKEVEDISEVFEEEGLTGEERANFWNSIKERGYKQNDAIYILQKIGIKDTSMIKKSDIPMLLSTHFPVKEARQ